jgi:hypothetical protein
LYGALVPSPAPPRKRKTKKKKKKTQVHIFFETHLNYKDTDRLKVKGWEKITKQTGSLRRLTDLFNRKQNGLQAKHQ